jgi:hypothetical protein
MLTTSCTPDYPERILSNGAATIDHQPINWNELDGMSTPTMSGFAKLANIGTGQRTVSAQSRRTDGGTLSVHTAKNLRRLVR